MIHDDVPGEATTPAGHAALLLVESLIHELVALRVLPRERAMAVVEIAADAAGEIAASGSANDEAVSDRAGKLLQAVAHTLSLDAGSMDAGDPTPAVAGQADHG